MFKQIYKYIFIIRFFAFDIFILFAFNMFVFLENMFRTRLKVMFRAKTENKHTVYVQNMFQGK